MCWLCCVCMWRLLLIFLKRRLIFLLILWLCNNLKCCVRNMCNCCVKLSVVCVWVMGCGWWLLVGWMWVSLVCLMCWLVVIVLLLFLLLVLFVMCCVRLCSLMVLCWSWLILLVCVILMMLLSVKGYVVCSRNWFRLMWCCWLLNRCIGLMILYCWWICLMWWCGWLLLIRLIVMVCWLYVMCVMRVCCGYLCVLVRVLMFCVFVCVSWLWLVVVRVCLVCGVVMCWFCSRWGNIWSMLLWCWWLFVLVSWLLRSCVRCSMCWVKLLVVILVMICLGLFLVCFVLVSD